MPCEVVLTPEFAAWLGLQDEDDQDRLFALLNILAEKGVSLGGQYSSGIKASKLRGLRELRQQVNGRPFRLFYIFDEKRNAVILAGGDKTGKNQKRWYHEMIREAESAYERYRMRRR